MKKNGILFFILFLIVLCSCTRNESAFDILQASFDRIDNIESIYFKQDMKRTNPRDVKDTIYRYREMYFERLLEDSIVGVKGHWYMYINDKEKVIFEDIYDGKRLLRKNNRDSVARIYDLVKYPAFKSKHFWSHNTLYGMQYEFKYILNYPGSFILKRLNDTIVEKQECYQILLKLEDKMTMPGFAFNLEDSEGSISESLYFFDKKTYYPLSIKTEYYSKDNSGEKAFLEQKYYDLKFNIPFDEDIYFNTSDKSISGFRRVEMKPE